jgi:hypothetical protein
MGLDGPVDTLATFPGCGGCLQPAATDRRGDAGRVFPEGPATLPFGLWRFSGFDGMRNVPQPAVQIVGHDKVQRVGRYRAAAIHLLDSRDALFKLWQQYSDVFIGARVAPANRPRRTA